MSVRLGLSLCLLLMAGTWHPCVAQNCLVQDPGFDRADTDGSPWQVRYCLKASEPSSRPRWRLVAENDEKNPEQGQHLHVKGFGPAAGTVCVGQPVDVPGDLEGLELSIDYQTYCELSGRSGMLSVAAFAPEAWDEMSTEPSEVKPPPEPLWQELVHPNGDDVKQWRRARARTLTAADGLSSLAGKRVVLAAVWSTWHPSRDEWARLDNFWFGDARPHIEAEAWPRWTYEGEPVQLTASAVIPQGARILLRYRQPEEDWRETDMAPGGAGRFAGEIPATAFHGVLQAQAVLSQAGETDITTPVVTIGMTHRPEHPSLFYNKDELTRMCEKIDQFEWAKETFAGLKRKADQWVERSDDPPSEPGGWSHDYVCPKDGARLKFREDHPTEHLCPTCGEEFTGAKLDAVWRGSMHGGFIGAARDMALVYHLSGQERYGRAAARIVDWYAQHYADFPLGRGPAGRGRVMSQSLSECTWLIRAFDAADLAWPVMTDEQRRRAETQLVRAGAQHIRGYTFGIHNIQCWHNACYAAAGYFLGDPEMVRQAREGSIGFDRQIERGILEDGMWFERSLGYHNYTLGALIAHCEVARHAGDDLHLKGRIREMFTLPLRLAQPNLVPPSLNDQGYAGGRIGPDSLERALAWYGDEQAARALKLLYSTGRKRRGLVSLQYGEPLPEFGDYVPPGSESLPGAGLAILRQGEGQHAACAMLEFGEHGGGHGHPDKLQLILYGLGRTLCPDPGTTGYGVPLHGRWFKQTAAHNTVAINQTSQRRTTGKLLAFEEGDGYAAATAESAGAYEGHRLVRQLLLTEGLLVDVFSISGGDVATLDWFLRAPGELSVDLAPEPISEEAPNATYAYLTDMRAAVTDGQWTAVWNVDEQGGRLVVTLQAAPGTQVAQCMAPGIPGRPAWHTLRVRRRAARTRFIAVHQMLGKDEQAKPLALAGDQLRIGRSTVILTPADEALRLEP